MLIWATLAATTGFIVVDKVFSPQYLLWLTPNAAAGLQRVRPGEGSRLGAWSAGLVVACIATQLGPVRGLWTIADARHGAAVATVLLVARNLPMVGVFAYAGAMSLRLAATGDRDGVADAPMPANDSSAAANARITS